MKKVQQIVSLFFAILPFSLFAQQQIPNTVIGSWVDHSSYGNAFAVANVGTQIFTMGTTGLFAYDYEDGSFERFSKVEGLSDAGYSAMAYNEQKKTLVIAYQNSNIDLWVGGRIYNISGLKEKNMQGDKAIYSISFNGKYAYLACGFGILVVDLDKREIHDTYIIGDGGKSLKTNSVAFTNTSIVAATDSGVYSANKNSLFLANYVNWTKDQTLPRPNSKYKEAIYWGDKLIVSEKIKDASGWEGDSCNIYYLNNTLWDSLTSLRYNSFFSNDDKLLINAGQNIYFYNKNLERTSIFSYGGYLSDALLTKSDKLWLSHPNGGILEVLDYKNSSNNYYRNITGPATGECFRIKSFGEKVFIAPGGRDQHYNPRYLNADVFTLANNSWKALQPINQTLYDVIDVAVDPNNSDHLFASSWGSGLLEIKSNQVVKVYNTENSPLQVGTEGIRLAGSVFDDNGNLWVLNSQNSHPLLVLRSNGTWDPVNTGGIIESGYDMGGIMIDFFYGYKWIYPGNNYNKIYVTDGNKTVYINPNKGSNDAGITDLVTALVCDLEGTVWVGTNKGLKAIYNIEDVFSSTGDESNKNCENLLYQKDGFVQNLLGSDFITSIVIDGANRKWVGTRNSGVYLFSPDGTQELMHFTAENSPLPSNTVVTVSVHHQTGLVYFGTEKGTVAYKGTATSYEAEISGVYAYPNPVRPDYEGQIAIKGLVPNTIVKICDASGNIVYNTKSNGGQAIWNGKNMNGKRVKTGVYFVFAINQDDTKDKAVTKILFIN